MSSCGKDQFALDDAHTARFCIDLITNRGTYGQQVVHDWKHLVLVTNILKPVDDLGEYNLLLGNLVLNTRELRGKLCVHLVVLAI